MKIRFTREFTQKYRKTDPRIQNSFDKRLKLFLADPFSPILNNHSLTGNYQGYRSINVTGDWRAIYSESKDEAGQTEVIFKTLGTHNQLYK